MAEELDLDTEIETEIETEVNKTEKRIKDLSEKVKLTAEERDEQIKLLTERDVQLAKANKEIDFFKNFSPMTSKYQAAGEFQDKIKEKVMAGYEVEDATVAILAKEGKLTVPTVSPPPKENPAGGSASNTISAGGEKPLAEMTRDEKRAALVEAEARGDIGLS